MYRYPVCPFVIIVALAGCGSIANKDLIAIDSDGDGYDNTADCNDGDPIVNPGAVELCGMIDHNCNGIVGDIDPLAINRNTIYADFDGDGFGGYASPIEACNMPSTGFSTFPTDCDNNVATIYPNAPEMCAPVDRDCDGLLGYDDPDAVGQSTYFLDADGDGFGTTDNTIMACFAPPGYVGNAEDCNDVADGIYPEAPETCTEVDQDCDGLPGRDDPDASNKQTFYSDGDGDGYGNPSTPTQACYVPPGYVSNAIDCDDTDPLTNPSSAELFDDRDNDCDGPQDEDWLSEPFTHPPKYNLEPDSCSSGDDEFDGNGPRVDIWVWLRIHDDDELELQIEGSWRETVSDWTEACLDVTFSSVYQAPSGCVILELTDARGHVVNEIVDSEGYTDTDHTRDEEQGEDLINVVYIYGDTNGDDIGHGTKIDEITFRTISVSLYCPGS